MPFAAMKRAATDARTRSVLRFALVYAACWTPLIAIYGGVLPVMTAGTLSAPRTVLLAFANAFGPAAMGVPIWWLSGQLRWPDRKVDVFFTVHAALSVVYALGWMAWEFTIMGPVGGARTIDYTMLRYVLPWQAVIGFILYGVVAGVSYAVRGVLRSRDLLVAAERAERLRAQAELAALRAHINPHFFFNTLHSVSRLLRANPAAAETALERLSDLFRYVLRLDRHRVELVTFEEEWEFTRSYLWLEQLRMGARLQIDACIGEDALECAVPPFTLQPLVENAVRHGLAPKREGGTIRITADERDGMLSIKVSDDGLGTPEPIRHQHDGLGIRAVSQRLAAQYGEHARTWVESEPGHGYTVSLTLPAETSLTPAPTPI